jgi:hypothetical protein
MHRSLRYGLLAGCLGLIALHAREGARAWNGGAPALLSPLAAAPDQVQSAEPLVSLTVDPDRFGISEAESDTVAPDSFGPSDLDLPRVARVDNVAPDKEARPTPSR